MDAKRNHQSSGGSGVRNRGSSNAIAGMLFKGGESGKRFDEGAACCEGTNGSTIQIKFGNGFMEFGGVIIKAADGFRRKRLGRRTPKIPSIEEGGRGAGAW
jgi:hypothetical protein